MQKLHPRYARIIVPVVLTFFMTSIVAGLSTVIAVGINWTALKIWPGAWMASWAVAAPTALFMLPLAQWITSFVVQKPK